MQRSAASLSAILCILFLSLPSHALSFRSIGGGVGIDLTQSDNFQNTTGAGQGFDQARIAAGLQVNLGSVLFEHLDLVPTFDAVIEDDLRIYATAVEVRYRFSRTENQHGYAGAGFGLHFFRPTGSLAAGGATNDQKISLNIPIGFRRRLNGSLGWFGELKMVIADQETDSSFRFSIGLVLGRI